MNQKMRKILSFVLVLCMLLTNASMPAFAAEGDAGSTTTNGSYDANGNWVQGGTGSATYNVDGTNVTLSKTATPTGNENEFEITLKVETSTTTTLQTDGGAVVLVIDVSGSMKYCADCGGENGHESDCGHYNRWNNSVTTAQSRMQAAKTAATNFLSSYAGTDPAAARMVAIVSFQSDATTRLEWVNVAGKQHDYQTALNTINSLNANGGTNLDDGLYHALALLNSDTVKDFTSKNVIALTDGAPTYSRSTGNGTRGNATINSHTAAQAANVRNTGATLYTVCFGVADDYTYSGGPTVGNFLSGSVASSGCAYNADNSSELYSVFAAITESITSGLSGSGWTATDPMADMISVTGETSENFTSADGKTYTWTLADAKAVTNGNVTTYTYTYSYTVKLNVQGQNFEEGKFFPTNDPTYLNIDGQQYAFPVPGVQGKLPRTDVSVTKVWDDAENQDGVRPDSVTVQLMEGERTIGDPVVLNANNNWTYTWNGEEYNLLAMSKGAPHVYTVKELDVPKDYTASVTTKDFAITVTNTHEVYKTAVEVTKVWNDNNDQDGKRPDAITVHLFANGEEIASADLNAAGSWKHVFDGLDLNANGKPVEYTVTEDSVPGYTTKIDGYVVTNTHEVEKTAVKVSKVWNDANNQDGKRTEAVTIRLVADGVDTGKTLTLSEANGWSGSFTELDKYSNAKEIKYTVSEDTVPGYTAAITGTQADGYTVTNSHTPEVITLSGSKTWNDADNQDGVRPRSITVRLLANGTEVASQTVSASNWSWTFENMPKYAGGQQITYTVTEDAVDGYTPSYDGLNITNTHTPDQTFVEVTKIWKDADNQDGKRPQDIKVVLVADGADTDKTLTLNAANSWHGVFENLDVNKNGVKIDYTVKEIEVAEYETEILKTDSGYTITNTHTPETVEVSGAKTWDDANNQDGKRPASITINLLADGIVQKSVEVTEADGWKWTFENLPKYAAGKEIVYSITEDKVDNYSTTYDGNNVINSYTPAKTSITVNKIWQDNNNQDDIRPENVTVILLANGEPNGKELVLTEIGKWTGTFTELPVYANGQEIVYTIKEVEVDGYTTAIDGYTITNTHIPYMTEVAGAKTWKDNSNQDGFRPESITINLLANGVKIESKTVTANDGWKWSFTNLPVNENGEKITYTITENAVEEYTTEINGYNVTNTHAPEKTSVTVTKSWQDSNDQDGRRANDVTISLRANDVDTGKTLVLNEGNSWSGTFSDLDKYENGQEIVYTVTEKEVPGGYNVVITGSQANGYIVTNSHTPETTTVSGAKTWEDNDNQDGFRPESITINLLANGKVIQTLTVTAEDGWAWSFKNLPKYENHGTLIEYTITEAAVEDYSTTYNGFNVTNTHTPEQTSVTVTKAWKDNDDQDGIRPNDITVILLANKEETGKTLVLNEGNNWTGSFTELDKYEDGVEIEYTVAELKIEGYNTSITGSQANGYTITNSHNPETIAVSGAKTWVDAENQDGKRPESITINLLADGEVKQTITVTESDGWAWSFKNLPKYKDHGTAIVYTVTEGAVDEYTTEINGFNVINTHAPEKTSVNVIKAWEDSNDQDGIRPNDITVELLANGEATGKTITLSEGNNWNGTFADLDKYENGEVIVYEVAELTVEGYNSVITGDQTTGYIITNSHTPEVVAVSGSKTWDDNDNQDGFRPESITINLLADGEIIETIEVTEEDEWAWSFENLPKYRDHGTEIVYAITENAIDDYSTEYDGFNVTNKHTPEQTSVTVTKSWQDSDDQDGIRPEEITVILLANGEATREKLVLDADNNWTGSFTELDVYAEGEKIVYTVEEIEIEGYETVITGDQTAGFQITNSHTPETIEISGSKTWDDANDQDGARPESITVNLMANGKVVKTATVTEAENWSYTFENLPKYENGGNEIIYAITEEAVEGYTTTYDGYNITNSYTPAEISLTVTKAWADSDDEDGLRPKKVTILLYADGELVDEKLVLSADSNWSGSFVGLPKYANGVEIVYTIGEVSVEGYNTVIRGNMTSGFVVTNSHTVIPQTGDERTPILWMLMLLGSVAVVAYMGYDYKKRRLVK